MQVVCECDYQDIYRITDGVLLVVNKFEYKGEPRSVYTRDMKTGKYHKDCQEYLKVVKKDFYYKYDDITYEKGTVMYHNCVVQKTDDKSKWKYQIKTTGDAFSGNHEKMTEMLNTIRELMGDKYKN